MATFEVPVDLVVGEVHDRPLEVEMDGDEDVAAAPSRGDGRGRHVISGVLTEGFDEGCDRHRARAQIREQ